MGDHPMIWTNPAYNRVYLYWYRTRHYCMHRCQFQNFNERCNSLGCISLSHNSGSQFHQKELLHPDQTPEFKALVLTERGGSMKSLLLQHIASSVLSPEKRILKSRSLIMPARLISRFYQNIRFLSSLNYPPYNWGDKGNGSLCEIYRRGTGRLGRFSSCLSARWEFDGFPMWNWFSGFMGGIRFKNYIAATASAKVNIER